MNIQRFYAPTSREALSKARMAFGASTLILSNRPTSEGVEVLATTEDSVARREPEPGSSLQEALQRRAADDVAPLRAPARSALPHLDEPAAARPAGTQQSVQDDVAQLAMSTLSFQDYVRERMLRRRSQGFQAEQTLSRPVAQPPLPTFAQRSRGLGEAMEAPAAQALAQSLAQAAPAILRHNPLRSSEPSSTRASPRSARSVPAQEEVPTLLPQGLIGELQSVRDLIEERFNTLTWLGQTRQSPIQSSLTHKLIRAGYSPALSRALIEHLPQDLQAADAVRWLMQVLERNLRCDAGQEPLFEQGGVYALVGATGVGKTTTAAKLAALCAARHGAASVGLITLDTYRIGAHEQLRTYGRMLGIVAHQAHDQAALQDLLNLLAGKKLVLIDTTGVAPRDPRRNEILNLLELPNLQKLLAVNAAGQGEALDDVIQAFKARGSNQAILTKVDEAVKLGPSVDTLIRHQMQLRGLCSGQRVPEDWERADAAQLIQASMRAPARSAFDPKVLDLDFFFTPSGARAWGGESLHA
ncbi:flagellar biosynthesis protein FlhF [Comamonas composti]|uniref:flagellar biosynthesis protein FlhF n=1 Tax=Comamonas composti TaxID=408558 RepID=UPI000426771A|nr:flagellar biosynthesis protein FlhF [Comamonas composti]